jgi:hypothetical protein
VNRVYARDDAICSEFELDEAIGTSGRHDGEDDYIYTIEKWNRIFNPRLPREL